MKPAWRAVLALVLGELDDHLRPPNYGRPLKFIQLGYFFDSLKKVNFIK